MTRKVETKLEYIPVRQLSVVWVNSQRPYNEKWAKAICDDFDPDKFDPLIVTKPNGDGTYHIIEGQHRRHALEMYASKFSGDSSNEQAPCRIIADADPARAAEIWLGINGGRKAISPIHGFLVAVVACREPEVTINNLVIGHGYTISSARPHGSISAVSALKTVYNRHGRVTLSNLLRVLRIMWHGDPAAVNSQMLRGFGLFIHEFGSHIDEKRLITKVALKWSPYKLLEAAKTRKQSSLEKIDEAIAELILREYNLGLKEYHKLRRKG